MDFAHVVRVLLRRWLIMLLGLAAAGGAAFAAYQSTPRSYEASSQVMVLLSPKAANPDLETSPFLYLPDGLQALARVATLIPGTPEYRAAMAAQGFEPAYTVTLQTREPLVTFTVESSDPANALETRNELMRRFSSDLDRIQREEGVPQRQWAHIRVLHASDTLTASSGSALRTAAAVGVVLLLVTLLVVALVERRSTRRTGQAKRAESRPERSGHETGTVSTPDSSPDDDTVLVDADPNR